MTKDKSPASNFFMIYFVIGVVISSITFASSWAFYTFGPRAIWNIGYFDAFAGLISSLFMSVPRIVLWPYGLYILVTDPSGFLPWLFYVWYS